MTLSYCLFYIFIHQIYPHPMNIWSWTLFRIFFLFHSDLNIVNGNDSDVLPYLVSIQLGLSICTDVAENGIVSSKAPNHTHQCGGAIVSKNYILSAAHCYEHRRKLHDNTTMPHFSVVAGQNILSQTNENQRYCVDIIVYHPNYRNYEVNNSK